MDTSSQIDVNSMLILCRYVQKKVSAKTDTFSKYLDVQNIDPFSTYFLRHKIDVQKIDAT